MTLLALALLVQALPAPAAPPVVADVARPSDPADVKLGGVLGARLRLSEQNRLRTIDEDALLEGFRRRPGKQAWIGEHVGKWLNAATLSWRETGNELLRAQIDRVRDALLRCQEPDGYLGTYVAAKRFSLEPENDWDVWVHKYVLLGLLTDYEFTGNAPSLDACRRIGDLLCRTFGPGKKSLLAAGTHAGMAATSVLEPMVLLYRWTGEPRYLDFCKSIVACWSEPGGPDLLRAFLAKTPVNRIVSTKAYEMLSNLVGLCELYRQTGERDYLTAALNAWDDIAHKRIYPTGSGSSFEHWQSDGFFPTKPEANLCEVCVTVTWLQLNAQLLRLTAETRFGDEIERTAFNHLIAAQSPNGAKWSYFTPLEGARNFSAEINCCASSGPRGLAILPTVAVLRTERGLLVNLLPVESIRIDRPGGPIRLRVDSEDDGASREIFTFRPEREADSPFEIALRIPASSQASIVDADANHPGLRSGTITQSIEPGRRSPSFGITSIFEEIRGEEWGRPGRVAIRRGPIVLVARAGFEAKVPSLALLEIRLPLPEWRYRREQGIASQPADGFEFHYSAREVAPIVRDRTAVHLKSRGIEFVDFGHCGDPTPLAAGSRIWIHDAARPQRSALFAGWEGYSRGGNQPGLISDDDPETIRVTWDGERADCDWFSVIVEVPVDASRIVFRHGRSFHDGGWFDVESGGKPQIQVRANEADPWIDIGELESYPNTTATDSKGLVAGQPFEIKFPRRPVCAVRVVGVGACGDDPKQRFSSCAELEAYAK